MENTEKKNIIDLGQVFRLLLSKKKKFFIIWVITAALSILWVIPQPRFYTCEVSLAPEAGGTDVSGLASVASSFGFNLSGDAGADAIYPLLYPELLQSNEFVAGLLCVKVSTQDKSVAADYYTYLKKHQKKNWLTEPFKKMFSSTDSTATAKPMAPQQLNPFNLSKKDYELFEDVKERITCNVDKKTNVISIAVKDQDPLVCATMADSVRQHLQDFITEYRTKKARIDADHYKHLADSAEIEYNLAVARYSAYCDANQDVILQAALSERDKLESDLQLKYNSYTVLNTQYEALMAKVQEKTPAFTVLKSASVPVKPAGPKRMIFVIGVLFLTTIVSAIWLSRRVLFK